MNAQLTDERATEAQEPDGLLLARVRDQGAWAAVLSLRAEMIRLAQTGEPHATFVMAIAEDGREVQACDPDAIVLAMGYRVQEPVSQTA